MPSNHLILCCPLLLLPSIFPSIRVFSKESVLCIRWPNYSFNFSISPSNKYSGLISFRIDWCDLLAVQGTLKSLFQYHSSKASILQFSAFLSPCIWITFILILQFHHTSTSKLRVSTFSPVCYYIVFFTGSTLRQSVIFLVLSFQDTKGTLFIQSFNCPLFPKTTGKLAMPKICDNTGGF